MLRSSFIPAGILLLCFATVSAWASPGTVLRNERLYARPSPSAPVAGTVTKGAAVTIVSKQGGWLRVTSGRTTGWIRLLAVRAGGNGASGAGVGDVFGAATRRADPSRVVAVAGLRGLNDEDLKQAKFNAEEMARLESIEVSTAQTRTFARQAGLVPVDVPALPAPAPAQPASSWGNN